MRWSLFGDRPPLTEEERRLVLRVAAVISIPLALIVLVTVIAGGAIAVKELRERTRENRKAVQIAQEAAEDAGQLALRIDEQRITQQNALAWRVYDECVENENQDAANDAIFRKVREAFLAQPRDQRSVVTQELIDVLTDTIRAREPADEKDCQQPTGVRPS